MSRRAAVVALAAGVVGLVSPATAVAHGIVGRTDLPVPRWLFGWAAALVLLLSFVALATMWARPHLQEPERRRVARIPGAVDVLCGAVGIALFGLVVYAGLVGAQSVEDNLAPRFIFVLLWVGVPVASVLAGDVFTLFSPWRALARGVAWLAAAGGRRALPEPLPYPDRLGHWPATAGVLAFVWLELIYADRNDPSTLGVLALVYAAIQLVGMSLYGIDRWSERGDGLGVLFGLFARLSPWERREGVLYLRPPLAGAPSLPVVGGTVALLCAAIGTTTFDGFSQGPLWQGAVRPLSGLFDGIGLGQNAAYSLAMTLGLALCVVTVYGLFRIGVQGMRSIDPERSGGELAHRFVHTLIPIAFAYALAHYFSLLAYEGQAVSFLASDPLGRGWNLFGAANAAIDYGVIGATGIWYVQVAALVVGHVSGLVLAHDRALALYGQGRDATRSQYWMLVVMVGFTSLGLWLLSALDPS